MIQNDIEAERMVAVDPYSILGKVLFSRGEPLEMLSVEAVMFSAA
jgi:hypothetical protein